MAAIRLALGTAQFGLAYGLANAMGKVAPLAVADILACARKAGIDTLDTAVAYGDSEAALGQAGIDNWQVVTKLPPCPDDCADVPAWVNAQVAASRLRLGLLTQPLYAVLLHRPLQLLDTVGVKLYAALLAAKQAGITQRVGVSIYEPAELDALQDRFALDLVQLPLNILDARWLQGGWLERLHAQGVEIHTRSIFLQGLLLMPAARRPAYFSHWQPLWGTWADWLSETRQSALQACLRHALNTPNVHRVVVGVDSLAQLQQILAAASGSCPAVPPELAMTDPALLNPALWKLT